MEEKKKKKKKEKKNCFTRRHLWNWKIGNLSLKSSWCPAGICWIVMQSAAELTSTVCNWFKRMRTGQWRHYWNDLFVDDWTMWKVELCQRSTVRVRPYSAQQSGGMNRFQKCWLIRSWQLDTIQYGRWQIDRFDDFIRWADVFNQVDWMIIRFGWHPAGLQFPVAM